MRAMSQNGHAVGPVFHPGPLPAGDGERRRTQRSVARAADGDADALRELYVQYAHGIYGYVRSIVSDEHEAEDVTQQVFLKLMTALPLFSPRRAEFSAWILRIARNTAIDHVRRRSHAVACDPLEWRVGAPAADAQASGLLREAIGGLTRDQREVLVMRQVMGLTPHEVAGRLGKSDGAVHRLYHRARIAARANLEGLGETPMVRA
jgi:RNA polymerase sigma-70 factor (ECF subfamily)